jgi:hypothetical protein
LIKRRVIVRAIKPGTRCCRDQREWLAVALAAVEAEQRRADWTANASAVVRQLMRHMTWKGSEQGVTRPGHERIAAAVRVSTDTVGRVVAWLIEHGLLGLVSPGTTPELQPHILHGHEGNLAAVYICTVPREKRRLPVIDAGQRETADLPGHRRGNRSPRAREDAGKTPKPEVDRAPRGRPPLLPRTGDYPRHDHPKTRSEEMRAAAAIRNDVRALWPLSDRHIRHLARPFFAACWPPADVVNALDHDPTGRQYAYTADVRAPAAWMAHRLAAWIDPLTGTPMKSRRQLADDRRRQVLADQADRRAAEAERRPGAAAAAARGGQLVRDALRAALNRGRPAAAT